MPRKSSIMAKINDTLTVLAGYIKDAQDEMTGYIEDAEQYRDLKPMLNKLASKTGLNTGSQVAQDKTGRPAADQPADAKPGDLITHNAAEHCNTYKKRSRKEKAVSAEDTNQSESNSISQE